MMTTPDPITPSPAPSPQPAPAPSLSDEELEARLKRLPAFADLFAEPEPPKGPPVPVRRLAEARGGLREELRAALAEDRAEQAHAAEHAKLGTPAAPAPQTWRERLGWS